MLIAGIGGSGKSTLARRLEPLLGIPRYCLDDLYYAPGLRMAADFPDRIEQITRGAAWLFDSQGPPPTSEAPPSVRDILWSRADTLIWLDYPRHIVVRRAIRRSTARIVTRRRLWQGYRESPLALLDPLHPIRRAWSLHADRRLDLQTRTAAPAWAHLAVLHFPHPRDTTRWLRTVAATAHR